jgi:integrase
MLFHTAKRDGYIVDDPSEFIDPVRSSNQKACEVFTISELNAVLSVVDTEWRSLVLFGLYTGQRLGDISMLTWDNLDLEDDLIRFIARKTQKTIIIPIAPPLRTHIDSMPISDVPGAPLHPRAFKLYPAGKLSADFAKVLAQAGLREHKTYKPTGKGRIPWRQDRHALTFHSLRHTAVSLLKDAGVPQAAVMEFVGHSSQAMSQHYTHVGMDSLKKAAASFPSL